MLLPVATLLRRLRGPASRAQDIATLSSRLRQAARTPEPAEATALAAELRARKPEVLSAFRAGASCQSCARGHTEPHGHWDGGFCCGGRTDGVFSDDEVAALALAGTRPRHLRPPAGDHAGCAFRGPTGCSLDAVDRPAVCVRYACRQLEAELRASGEWEKVRALTRRLEETFARFAKVRSGV